MGIRSLRPRLRMRQRLIASHAIEKEGRSGGWRCWSCRIWDRNLDRLLIGARLLVGVEALRIVVEELDVWISRMALQAIIIYSV